MQAKHLGKHFKDWPALAAEALKVRERISEVVLTDPRELRQAAIQILGATECTG